MLLRKRRESAPAPAPVDPVQALRDTWSNYARVWDERPDLNLGAGTLGEEWGGANFAQRIVTEVATPYLGPEVRVLELGCGGGKFSAHLRPRSRHLTCADISADMLARTRAHVGEGSDVDFLQLNGRDFAGVGDASVDFIFSYDVLLHLQPQNVFAYLLDARRILRPGGIFMVHAINLASPGGSYHFELQFVQDTWSRPFEDPHRLGHIYYMSEDQLGALAGLARFSADRVIGDWPRAGDPEAWVTSGRDIFAFLRREPGLPEVDVRPVKTADGRKYAVVDGRRRVFTMDEIVEQAGLREEDFELIDDAALAALPEDQPVSRWELPELTTGERTELEALRARVAQLERERAEQIAAANAAVAAAQERAYWLDRWHLDLNALMAKPRGGRAPGRDPHRARGRARGEAGQAQAARMTFSVVIPVLDGARYLGELLAALPDGVETLVIDSGSTDGSVAIAHDAGAECWRSRSRSSATGAPATSAPSARPAS